MSVLFFSKISFSQNLYFNNQDDIKFADRLQTLYGHNGDTFLLYSPLSSMADAFNLYNYYKTDVYNGVLSNRDMYRLNQYLVYFSDMTSAIKDPLLPVNTYSGWLGAYKNTPFLLEKKGQMNLLVQPVFAQTVLYEVNNNRSSDNNFYNQTYAGLYTRLSIGERFGLQLRVLYRHENLLDHFHEYGLQYNAIPGYFMKNGYNPSVSGQKFAVTDILPTGQVVYDIIPRRLSVMAGYDQISIGEGIRSLVQGRSGAPVPFAAVKTKFWKFDYTNIFTKLSSQNIFTHDLPGAGQNKYMAMHQLSINIGKRFNVGLFETIISSRDGAPEMSYFNPVIFYRAIERHIGSPDKMALGLTGSAVISKGLKVYGQVFINEFVAKEFFSNKGFIHNKWGLQAGIKYYDVARIDNLDMQLEMNIVRPYAYQHRSNANFSHNNQPIAHPLGADFKEYLAHLSYQPHTKVTVLGRLHHYIQGKDINNDNYGSNILRDIRSHPSRYGVHTIHGQAFTVTSADMSVRYEFLPHTFIEIGGMYRKEELRNAYSSRSLFGFASLQFHLNRRDLMIF